MHRHNLNAVCAAFKEIKYYCSINSSRLKTTSVTNRGSGNQPYHQRFYSQTINQCWNCNEPLSTKLQVQFTCEKCRSLLKLPKNCNYFQVMGLDRKYTINSAELTKRFRSIQTILHPDKFSNKSDEEQTLSADWSSLVNNAYKTLQSPIQRGEYLLQLHGVTIPEDNSELNKEFLMEMMERNEEVDDADTEKELSDLLHKVRSDLSRCAEQLEKSLNVNQFQEAKADIITLRYFLSLENSIKEKGNRLGIHL